MVLASYLLVAVHYCRAKVILSMTPTSSIPPLPTFRRACQYLEGQPRHTPSRYYSTYYPRGRHPTARGGLSSSNGGQGNTQRCNVYPPCPDNYSVPKAALLLRSLPMPVSYHLQAARMARLHFCRAWQRRSTTVNTLFAAGECVVCLLYSW